MKFISSFIQALFARAWILLFLNAVCLNAQNSNSLMSDTISVAFELPELTWIHYQNDSFPNIHSSYLYEAGAPQLPQIIRVFDFSEETTVRFHITEIECDTLIASISPSPGLVTYDERDKPAMKGEQYKEDCFYPATWFHTDNPYYQQQTYHIPFAFYPFRYNPVNQQLIVCRRAVVQLIYQSKSTPNKTVDKETATQQMVIISPDNYAELSIEYANWKSTTGINTFYKRYAEIGDLKEYLTEIYRTSGLDYVLLVGDFIDIPGRRSTYGYGDYDYGCIVGDDAYAEISIGRLPVDDVSQLANLFAKSRIYHDLNCDALGVNRFLGIASNEAIVGDRGETDLVHIENIATQLRKCGYETTIVTPDYGNTNQISNIISQGVGLINYAGHGNTCSLATGNYTCDSVSNIAYSNLTPFFMDVACKNGDYQSSHYLAKTFMNHVADGKVAGTIAMLASTSNQAWIPPMMAQDEMINAIVNGCQNNTFSTLGQITQYGMSKMLNHYCKDGVAIALTWVFFGDPSLPFFYREPSIMTMECEDVIDVRKSVFSIHCSEEDALVSLLNKGQLMGQANVIDGIASINYFSQQIDEPILVRLFKPGYKTVEKSIDFYCSNGAYYTLLNEHDDSWLIAGDSILFYPKLINKGDAVGEQVEIDLINSDVVHANNSSVYYKDINAGDVLSNKGIMIYSSSDVIDGDVVDLDFIISDAKGQTNYVRNQIKVKAAKLGLSEIYIDDEIVAHDTLIVHSDKLTMGFLLTNNGSALLNNGVLKIMCSSPHVEEIVCDSLFSINPHDKNLIEVILTLRKDINSAQTIPVDITFQFLNQQITKHLMLCKETLDFVELGNQSIKEDAYPFNNYYYSSKTQLLINKEELQWMDEFDAIGFNITHVPLNKDHALFNNLSISIGFTVLESFDDGFVNTSSVVYKAETAYLPTQNGLFYFEITPTSCVNDSNMVISIEWGSNYYDVPFSDSYELMCSKTSFKSAAYTNSNNNSLDTPSAVCGVRPNIYLKKSNIDEVDFIFKWLPSDEILCADYLLKIGQSVYSSNLNGEIELSLPIGNYNFKLQENSKTHASQLSVTPNLKEWIYNSTSIINPIDDEAFSIVEKGILRMNDWSMVVGPVYIYDVSGKLLFASNNKNGCMYFDIGNIEGLVLVVANNKKRLIYVK